MCIRPYAQNRKDSIFGVVILFQKYVGFGLTFIAIACFIPGVYLPMFQLSMDMNLGVAGNGFNQGLINQELSIITTVTELWEQNRYLVSALIFIFSIVIPIFKTSAIVFVLFAKTKRMQRKISAFVAAIGKWSMADVFVVAVFLAVLSTNHTDNQEQHQLSFFGFTIDFEISTQMLSMVGQGFYFFVAYCLISLLGSQLVLSSVNQPMNSLANTAS
jgi:uncharacterized paraquat-inducible protein A